MKTKQLTQTINALLADKKGILAMDESIATCNSRLVDAGIAPTPANRRSYRELIITTPELSQNISGLILFDETIQQSDSKGVPFIQTIINAGMIPGIKVDIGTQDLAGFPGEKITEGLDGLRERLVQYAAMGARFAKWRAVIYMGRQHPSQNCIAVNASTLARYASLCQECGLVPIIEPEVMMLGMHSSSACFKITRYVLEQVFDQLYIQGVKLQHMLLKPNMVLPGTESNEKKSASEVAKDTIRCLLESVPAAVPGIAFLSGGQDEQQATTILNELQLAAGNELPWTLTFSFGRALQNTALQTWKGKKEQVIYAQQALHHRAKCNRAANMSLYSKLNEKN